MDNASLILEALDSYLNHPVRLILYGRAAIQLGFSHPPSDIAQSKDVDGIIPLSDLEGLTPFWLTMTALPPISSRLALLASRSQTYRNFATHLN